MLLSVAWGALEGAFMRGPGGWAVARAGGWPGVGGSGGSGGSGGAGGAGGAVGLGGDADGESEGGGAGQAGGEGALGGDVGVVGLAAAGDAAVGAVGGPDEFGVELGVQAVAEQDEGFGAELGDA